MRSGSRISPLSLLVVEPLRSRGEGHRIGEYPSRNSANLRPRANRRAPRWKALAEPGNASPHSKQPSEASAPTQQHPAAPSLAVNFGTTGNTAGSIITFAPLTRTLVGIDATLSGGFRATGVNNTTNYDSFAVSVPEPATLALTLLSSLGLVALRRRR